MRLFLIIGFLCCMTATFSQTPIPKGRSQLNLGVGLSSWGVPVYVGFDVGARHDLSFGAEASFRYYHEKWKQVRYRHSIIGLSANGNYHFNRVFHIPSNWDLYAGLNLGWPYRDISGASIGSRGRQVR